MCAKVHRTITMHARPRPTNASRAKNLTLIMADVNLFIFIQSTNGTDRHTDRRNRTHYHSLINGHDSMMLSLNDGIVRHNVTV